MAETPVDPVVWRTRLVRMLTTGEAKQLRESIGMSREELGRKLGVNMRSVWRWETGQDVPRDLKVVTRWVQLLTTIQRGLADMEDAPPSRPAASLRYPRRRGSVQRPPSA